MAEKGQKWENLEFNLTSHNYTKFKKKNLKAPILIRMLKCKSKVSSLKRVGASVLTSDRLTDTRGLCLNLLSEVKV